MIMNRLFLRHLKNNIPGYLNFICQKNPLMKRMICYMSLQAYPSKKYPDMPLFA